MGTLSDEEIGDEEIHLRETCDDDCEENPRQDFDGK